MSFTNIETSATYNDDNQRILLTRKWVENSKSIDILMSFPSTADAKKDDRTTSRITSILQKNTDFGCYRLINLEIDGWEKLLSQGDQNQLILAWGSKIRKRAASREIRKMLFQKYENVYQFGEIFVEAMPTRLPNNTTLCKIN